MIIAGTGSCKRAMAVQVDVDPAWPVPGTNTWHCGHCTPAAELEAAFAWRLLWQIALALAEHRSLVLKCSEWEQTPVSSFRERKPFLR